MIFYRLLKSKTRLINNIDRLYISISTNSKLLKSVKPQSEISTTKIDNNVDQQEKERRSKVSINTNLKNEKDSQEWNVIYRFKRINQLSLVSRLKLYVTALSAFGLPYGVYGYVNGKMTFGSFVAFTNLTLVSLAGLYFFTYYTRRTVGVISRSTNGQLIRIGYLTFWGRRANVIMTYDDVIPFSDMGYQKDDVYVTLKRYSDPKFALFLPRKEFEILDEEEFLKIFDSLLD